MELIKRPRRLRGSANLRKMVRETRMDKSSLIYPLFVMEGNGIQEEIPSMEGQYRYSLDRLPYKLEQLEKAGVNSIMLFGIPAHKDEVGSGAYAQDGIVQKALREAKSRFPEMYYVTDVCMCEYTSHGHCGVLCGHDVDNDKTLELLAKTALSHAQAGSDMIAPSDMMDGRVAAIRKELDLGGYTNIPIMSYAVKYASAFYGPFRDAAGSAPAFGDRKSYQMDFHNRREGMKEALMDIEEGADIIMVKPAMSYLDMVSEISKAVNVPVAAYSVSGEYAMVKAAEKAGVTFMAGHVMNFFCGVRHAKQLIAEGKIGRVLYIHSARNGWEEPQPEISWKKIRAKSGGHLYHHIHELDCIQFILGPATAVTMTGGNVAHKGEKFGDEDDMLFLNLEFASYFHGVWK